MTVVLGATAGVVSSRLGGPDGPPKLAAIDNLHLPVFYPSAPVVNKSHADAVFVMDPVDEPTVLAEGGMLHADPLTYADVAATKATLGTGRYRRSAAWATSKGTYVVVPDGLFGTDEWTAVIAVNPGGSDATALAGTWTLWKVIAGSQGITVSIGSSSVFASIGGTGGSVSVSKAIVSGNIPASTWTLVTVSWKASIANGLKITIGDSTSPTSSTNSANPAWLNKPFSGAPRIAQGNGLFIGHDRAAGGSEPAGVAVSDMVIYRYARTVTNQDFRPRPGVTVDAASTSGAWPSALAGVVMHHSSWDRSEAGEVTLGTALREAQLDLAEDAGCPHYRIAEFNERAIPTISGGVVQSVNVTDLIAHLDRALNRGATISMHLGFLPAAMGGGTGNAAYHQPNFTTMGAANQAAANIQFARYCSLTFTALKSYYDGLHGAGWFAGKLKSLSFWNEPQNQWSDGATAFVDLWEQCAIRMAADHPDLPTLGGSDGGSGTYEDAIRTRATANSRPYGSVHTHPYNPMSLTTHIDDQVTQKAAAVAAGFSSAKVQPTEWGMISAVTSGATNGQAIAAYENPQRQNGSYMAAYATAFIYEMLQQGATIGAFFRLGQVQSFSPTGQSEEMMGMMSNQNPPRPWPVFAAFELLWKLSGTRVSAVANFPHLRAMATKTAGGVITLVYGSFRGHRPREVSTAQIAWNGLPTSFTWEQWRVDARDETDGRPSLLDVGDETDLPLSFDLTGEGVGCIQITPA